MANKVDPGGPLSCFLFGEYGSDSDQSCKTGKQVTRK
jgi:hypothetical protein